MLEEPQLCIPVRPNRRGGCLYEEQEFTWIESLLHKSRRAVLRIAIGRGTSPFRHRYVNEPHRFAATAEEMRSVEPGYIPKEDPLLYLPTPCWVPEQPEYDEYLGERTKRKKEVGKWPWRMR